MAACDEKVAELVEWLGDTGASRHVCNDLSLMRDVRTRRKPIVLRQLVGEIQVYKTGTVQLDCPNNFGGSTTVSLLDTCYIPEAKVNLFSLQKLRKSLYITEQGENLGTQWVRNSQGDYIMGMKEDSEGRVVIDCTTLLPDCAAFPAETVEVGGGESKEQVEEVKEAEKEEALVAAIDAKVLHRRVGHLGKVGMERLARKGLVRGLEGGVAGEMEMCEGCELSRPRPHPHRPVDLSHRSTRPLELVHADLAGPIRVQSWGGSKYMFVLVDDFSRKSWVILLKNKGEAGDRLKEWKALVENERGLKLGRLRTDNGG